MHELQLYSLRFSLIFLSSNARKEDNMTNAIFLAIYAAMFIGLLPVPAIALVPVFAAQYVLNRRG